jgi:integrase
MPARQRGFARKRGNGWLAGWYEDGRQRTRGGFETRTAALDYANEKAERVVARAAALRFGDEPPVEAPQIGTVQELVDAFLARHRVDEATLRKLRSQLRHATAAFGERRPETLQPIELDLWRSQLPALSAHYIFRAFRQVLEYAAGMGLLERNPTARIKNVRASVEVKRGQRPFESWEQVEAVAAELEPGFAAIPIVLVGTGLRPEELFALERRDLDLEVGVLSVERVYSQRRLKDCAKSSRQRRRVPLRQRVVEALRALPPRLDTPLLFPAARGGYICSRLRGAATSTARSSAIENGRPRFAQWVLSTAASMTLGTPSPPGRSRAECSCSTSPGSWAPQSRRSTRPTATCSPTRRTTCAGCSTRSTAANPLLSRP